MTPRCATGARVATSSASAMIPGACPINMCSRAREVRNTTSIHSELTARKAVKARMRTSATGTSGSNSMRASRAHSQGFTLIELMVVVFIIGLVTAAAIITFGGDRRDSELDKETERIHALLDYAREQAELQTRDYGIRINDHTYSFVVFDVLQNQWHTNDDDDSLRERE